VLFWGIDLWRNGVENFVGFKFVHVTFYYSGVSSFGSAFVFFDLFVCVYGTSAPKRTISLLRYSSTLEISLSLSAEVIDCL
jgi:hypothetical protein